MNRSEDHLASLQAHRTNGISPFCGSGGDIADQSLSQAHALATLMADAVDLSDERGAINPSLLHNAFKGIATLIALADFALSGEVK